MAQPKMPKFPSWTVDGKPHRYCFQLFKAKDGWRWRMWARNGRCIAESGEGYGANKAIARRMLNVVRGDRPIPVWLP